MHRDHAEVVLGEKDPAGAWRRLLSYRDVVGIKSNVWRFLPTPEELEKIIRQRVRKTGVRDENIGTDDRGVLFNPVFRRSTALINVRPMRTHHWSGVGSCIKNYIMFHPNMPSWHGDACADLAGLWYLPPVKGKAEAAVRLSRLRVDPGPRRFDRLSELQRWTDERLEAWSQRALCPATG